MLGSTSTSDVSHNHEHNHGHDVGERLYIHRHSIVHSVPAHLKILAGLLFIIVGVATSISNWQAFACYFLLIGSVLAIAKLPVKISRRGNKIMIDICGSILTKNIITEDVYGAHADEDEIFSFYRRLLILNLDTHQTYHHLHFSHLAH